jgi:hypothetical protein
MRSVFSSMFAVVGWVLLGKRLMRDYPPLADTAWIITCGTAVLTPVCDAYPHATPNCSSISSRSPGRCSALPCWANLSVRPPWAVAYSSPSP